MPLLAVLGVLGLPEIILVSAEGELGLRGLAEGPLSASSSSDEKSLFSSTAWFSRLAAARLIAFFAPR